MKKLLAVVTGLLFYNAQAQQPFAVSLVPSSITAMPPVHSFAFAEWNGKWIFIGGRLDGLHNFQGGMAFLKYMRNDSAYVVDPAANTIWVSALTSLPDYVREAISSSNAEAHQTDSMLYLIGGYGRCDSLFANITFPTLTAINLNTFVDAVINGTSIDASVRQIRDSNIIVTGGHLEKIDSTYYLLFGHRFDGMYSKITGSTLFIQTYTNEIRKFNIVDDGANLAIANYQAVSDTDHFHRRDLNLAEQIFPNGEYGFTAFGGVFQKTANLPYLTPIDITPTGYQHQPGFNQNLNQYETALMPLYDSAANAMHTIFFGGMSLYTFDTVSQMLVQDTLIPFVKTISKVSRDGSGNLTEFCMPGEMPGLLGSNARFIPDRSVYVRHESIIDLNSLSGNTRVGWIINGIESDLPNIADLDPESMSRPNTTVYEVWVDVDPLSVREVQLANSILGLTVYPSPARVMTNVDFVLNEDGEVSVDVLDAKGKRLDRFGIAGKKSQHVRIPVSTAKYSAGLYTCVVRTKSSVKEARFIVR